MALLAALVGGNRGSPVVPHADVRFDISLVVPTQSHLVWKKRKQIHGMKLGYEAPFLRHFTAGLEPEPAEAPAAMRS